MPSICQRRRAGRCVCPSAVSRMSRLAQGCVPCRSSMHTTSHACSTHHACISTTTGGIVCTCCGSHMPHIPGHIPMRLRRVTPQCHITSCVCDMHTTQQMYIKNTWFVSTLRVCVYEARYFLFSSLTYHLHVSYRLCV